ncbi:class C sortase [Arcanobacterium hippocoleae]|uniref:class C sortase n=1 Tax=Arcanobacterium hippocoleae TaxID=149017 RepID=UPI003341BF2A
MQTQNPQKQQKAASAVAPLILLLIGLVILLYPVLASQVNNHSQQVVVDEYRKLLQSVPKNDLNQAILEAQLYNQVLSSTPMLEPWPARVAEDNPDYQNYLSKLSVFPMMGTLEIPSIDVNLPIYHGTTDETLDKGIGHLFGTDLPVGGVGTHAVITGHTGLPYATMLDRLVDVQKGDTFSIYVAGEHLLYQVREIKVVSPEDVESLFPVPDKDLLTVVTCTPTELILTGY